MSEDKNPTYKILLEMLMKKVQAKWEIKKN
jgi:hypothetical protein